VTIHVKFTEARNLAKREWVWKSTHLQARFWHCLDVCHSCLLRFLLRRSP